VQTATASDGGATGALVAAVTSGSPAADAGLRSGDVVTSIDATRIRNGNDLVAAIAAHDPGDHVAVTVRRGSDTHDVQVTLGTQPSQASAG
jgi:putative serine protease PepD